MKLLEKLINFIESKYPNSGALQDEDIGRLLEARKLAKANNAVSFVDLETKETLLGGRVSMRVTFDFTGSN